MFYAYYITGVSLPRWLVAWTPNQTNPLRNKRVFQGIVAHWLYCSTFDRALTMWFIAKIVDISRDIADFEGFLAKYRQTDSSPWNIVLTPPDTRYIGNISPTYRDIFILGDMLIWYEIYTFHVSKIYLFLIF